MQHGRTLLSAYLRENGLSQADVARGVKIGTSLVSNYLSDPTAPGHRDPGLAHAFAIEAWTGGKVPREVVGERQDQEASGQESSLVRLGLVLRHGPFHVLTVLGRNWKPQR
jgi:transcriptional regulator with XRE-family HTH domain